MAQAVHPAHTGLQSALRRLGWTGMRGEELSDERLMLNYRDGDVEAFKVLYARHKGALYRYCLRHCAGRSTAEETFQDVWMRVIGARQRYQPQAKFSTWLYRIAHNRVIDRYRADNPGRFQSLDDDDATVLEPAAGAHCGPERRLQSDRQAARLEQLIAELPAEQRDVFLLREEAGLGLDAIAEVSGVGRETVKSRLRYALSKLRVALKNEQ